MKEESAWFYSAETVAKIQNFFGLQCVDDSDYHKGRCKGDDHLTTQVNGISRRNVPQQQDDAGTASEHRSSSGQEPRLGEPTASLADPVKYHVHNKMWYYLFSFGAALGDDIFYYTFYPFWFFNLSPWIIRRVIITWGVIMYVGQCSKELMKWPRPSAPPVVPLERRYFREYGMPSTHAMVGTLVPFTILAVSWDKVQYPPAVGVLLASSWCLLVCVSRLYKGMHYILDIIVGVVVTFILMFLFFQVLETLDTFLITHPYACITSIATALLLGIIYPTEDGWSSTRADTIVIMGVTTGVYSSIWLAHQRGIPPAYDASPPSQIRWPGVYDVAAMFLREFIGVAMMGVAHLTFKTIILGVLSRLSGQKITEETKKQAWVEIPYKFITYFAISASVFFVSPFIFIVVGL